MKNKYQIDFKSDIVKQNLTRLINQIWKILPMRENEENWNKQLETVTIEMVGLGEIFSHNPIFLQIISKLEGINKQHVDFPIFRKTIFEIISLTQEVMNYEE